MTVDVDVYDAEGEKVDIEELPGNSTIKISTKRMEDKDKAFQTLNISDPLATQTVLVSMVSLWDMLSSTTFQGGKKTGLAEEKVQVPHHLPPSVCQQELLRPLHGHEGLHQGRGRVRGQGY